MNERGNACPHDPVHDTVHHPYSAYNQGYDAAEAGHALALNPYETETREWRWWAMGWREWTEQQRDGWDYFDEPPPPPSTGAAYPTPRYRKVSS